MRDRMVLAGTVALVALAALSSGRRRKRVRAAAAAAGAVTGAHGGAHRPVSDPLADLTALDLFDPMLDDLAATEPLSGAPVVEGGRLRGGYLDRRTDTHLHRGVDIVAPRGTPVRPLAPGRVVELSPDGRRRGYGNAVLITHDDGVSSFYSHLDSFGPIKAGQRVDRSSLLGTVGSTQAPRPAMEMGPHLHLETHAEIVRGAGGRPIIREETPERYDPVLYAELIGVPLT